VAYPSAGRLFNLDVVAAGADMVVSITLVMVMLLVERVYTPYLFPGYHEATFDLIVGSL
jgi:hypothetical protein